MLADAVPAPEAKPSTKVIGSASPKFHLPTVQSASSERQNARNIGFECGSLDWEANSYHRQLKRAGRVFAKVRG